MRKLLLCFSFLALLAGCVATEFPEQNVPSGLCASGANSFSFLVDLPASYGSPLALTQWENGDEGLVPVCNLNTDVRSFNGFSGEVANGLSGMCISARLEDGRHVLSCQSAASVRRAMDAVKGTRADTLVLNSWRPFPG